MMSDLEKRVAGLSAKKRELLMRRLKSSGTGLAAHLLKRRPREASSYLLSFAQQRLWFLDQLLPGSAAYNVRAAFRLRGPLNMPALVQALNEIIIRHESLRTIFATEDGRPVQIILPEFKLLLPIIDIEEIATSRRDAEIIRLAIGEARQPFDLSSGPLLRATLLQSDRDDHVLLLTMHHIISDGWSMAIFMEEMALLYDAFNRGSPSPLRNLPIQYVDYASWQRGWLQGEVLAEQLDYWKRQLGGNLPTLNLHSDRPKPPTQTFMGAKQRLFIEKGLTESLKRLSRREGVTLFITIMAAFKVLLHRFTGQTDIVVGTPIANRKRSEVEGLIGFFANTLVLRSDLSGDPSFRDLLSRARTVATGAYDNQDLPFDKLVEELQPQRALNQTPLFQVMLQLNHAEIENVELSGLSITYLDIDSGVSKFDLSLSLTEAESGLSGWLEYNTDIFDASTISRLLGHYRSLLNAVAANPERTLSSLPLLNDAEKHQLLVEWNDARADYPADRCLHSLFEAQAEQRPDSVALVYEDEQLSYRQLNARANQLARHLRNLGISPNAPVGICLPRSIEAIIAILGVLKAGGAYVPLDPGSPHQRLAMMMEDAQVEVLLTEQSLIDSIESRGPRTICLDADWSVISRESVDNPKIGVTSEMGAYVIYTSGSTGRAKGVLVEQRQVVNYVFAIIERLGLAPGSSFAMLQPLSVDACKTALYPPLVTGGSVHIVSAERVANPRALSEYCNRHQLAYLKIAPSHLSALLVGHDYEAIMPRECLVIGGEISHWDFINRLRSLAPQCTIVNQYGPTETTVGMLIYRIGPETAQRCSSVPIGRPIANTQVYLLDRHLQVVPIGAIGELYIGGDCLARGYLNKPDLTAERFLPNPFSRIAGSRIYLSGDLARYLPDGNIEFLGRMDTQVKIRGLRIELGEIEAVLSQHPEVRASSVTTALDDFGGKRLVAYVVPGGSPEPSLGDLRCFLKERLPNYMIPSDFVMLESLPLTPHGKVNRQALPAVSEMKADLERDFAEPRSGVEKVLATIWREVLKVDKVGLNDNFFDLGGHSLLIVQVKSRILEVLDKEIPIIEMFRNPTVSALAKYLNQAEDRKTDHQEVRNRAKRQQAAINRQVEFIKGRRSKNE